jgi:hypothetical protein
MSATHFWSNSRKCDVEIATCPHNHLVNAHAKLADKGDAEDAETVAAMAAQIAINNEQYAEAEAARAQAERVA